MAAGLGSRYGGDKQVDGIGPGGEILMQYSIYDAIEAGFEKLVFVIKPQHRKLIEGFCGGLGEKGIDIEFVYQDFSSLPSFYTVPEERTKPFGTVHAVLCAKDAIKEPFAVLNADDYYGKDAFRVMHDSLVSMSVGEAVMVAYKLKNTVSLNGGVTRGICQVDSGRLAGVTETYSITVDKNGVIKDADAGELNGDALVSMNMWGFGSDIFALLEKEFHSFLFSLSADEIKKEYALPTFVDKMIKADKLSVTVLSTDAVWFGVTYREDREYVAGELKKMHNEGAYPKKLF
jgi:dTDP-glucose pyrophosphorylase